MTQLIVLRHGESEGNANEAIYKQKRNHEIELTKNGIHQIKQTALWIKSIISQNRDECPTYRDYPVYIFTSSYKRAIQTSQIICDNLPYRTIETIDPLLIEQQYGQADGSKTLNQFVDSDPIQSELFKLYGDIYFRPPQGESLYDVYIRCGLFFEKHQWFANKETIILSTHKSVALMIHYYLLNSLPNHDIDLEWNNGEATFYEIDNKIVSVKSEFRDA